MNRNVRFYFQKADWEYQLEEDIKKRIWAKNYLKDILIDPDPDELQEAESIGSIFIACEVGERTETLSAEISDRFPELNIMALWSGNSKDYKEELKTLREEGQSKWDIIIASPSWCYGIDIQQHFSSTYFDGTQNPQLPLRTPEIYQFCGRARKSKKIYICTRYKKYIKENYYPYMNIKFSRDSDNKELHTAYKKLGLSGDDWLPDSEPRNRNLLLTKMYLRKEKFKSDTWRAQETQKHFTQAGDNVLKWDDYLASLTKEEEERIKSLIKNKERLFKEYISGALPKNEEWEAVEFDMQKALGRKPPFNESDLIEYDSGGVIENKHRRRTLEEPDGYLMTSEDKELNALINRIRKLWAGVMRNQHLITNEQLKRSAVWKELYCSKERWNTLFESYQWDIEIKNETDLSPLLWLEFVLRKFHYLVEINRNGVKANYRLAMKEHNAEFSKWKKTNPKIEGRARLRYEDWLWEGLNEGFIQYSKLKSETRRYIQSFPHLAIKEYSRG